jgi:hypothetical protein
MLSLASILIVSGVNMAYAAYIYLTLHGWLVSQDTSGMQLLMHVIVTAPVVLVTTTWLFYLSKSGKCRAVFWKVNLVGLFVPGMSIQSGVTYYHFDKLGLVVSIMVPIALLALFTCEVKRSVCR